MHGRSFSCVGIRFGVWATVLVHGQPSSCVGNRFGVWVTVFVCGGRFHAWVVSLMQRWLLALVGSLLRIGSLSCGSAGRIVEGWMVLTVLKNNNERFFTVLLTL